MHLYISGVSAASSTDESPVIGDNVEGGSGGREEMAPSLVGGEMRRRAIWVGQVLWDALYETQAME